MPSVQNLISRIFQIWKKEKEDKLNTKSQPEKSVERPLRKRFVKKPGPPPTPSKKPQITQYPLVEEQVAFQRSSYTQVSNHSTFIDVQELYATVNHWVSSSAAPCIIKTLGNTTSSQTLVIQRKSSQRMKRKDSELACIQSTHKIKPKSTQRKHSNNDEFSISTVLEISNVFSGPKGDANIDQSGCTFMRRSKSYAYGQRNESTLRGPLFAGGSLLDMKRNSTIYRSNSAGLKAISNDTTVTVSRAYANAGLESVGNGSKKVGIKRSKSYPNYKLKSHNMRNSQTVDRQPHGKRSLQTNQSNSGSRECAPLMDFPVTKGSLLYQITKEDLPRRRIAQNHSRPSSKRRSRRPNVELSDPEDNIPLAHLKIAWNIQ